MVGAEYHKRRAPGAVLMASYLEFRAAVLLAIPSAFVWEDHLQVGPWVAVQTNDDWRAESRIVKDILTTYGLTPEPKLRDGNTCSWSISNNQFTDLPSVEAIASELATGATQE
jgi:hypothetical protein